MIITVKDFLLVERLRDPADFKIEKYKSDSELNINMDENTLFKKTVRYFIIKFYVRVLIEFWCE